MSRLIVQRLMDEAPRGHPLDTQVLRALGVEPDMASRLARSGWLNRLSKGVYLLRGDTPTRDGILVFFSRRIEGLHVAGKTALDWQGVRHNIAFHPRLELWGQTRYEFPDWVKSHLSFSYQTTTLFDEGFEYRTGLKPVPNAHPEVLVSVPERAVIELVSDIGKGQSQEEVLHLVERLRNLRPVVLDELLSHCTRVKVGRLLHNLGRAAGHEWAADMQKHLVRQR